MRWTDSRSWSLGTRHEGQAVASFCASGQGLPALLMVVTGTVLLFGSSEGGILGATALESDDSTVVVPAASVASQITAPDAGPVPEATASIFGSVRDEEGGMGIAGVRIEAYRWRPRQYQANEVVGLKRVAEAVSDAQGNFCMQGLEPGPYLITRQEAPGYGRQKPAERVRVDIEPGQRLMGMELIMARGVAAEGRVVDRHGHGVPGAEVRLWQRNGLPRVTHATADGRFCFHDPEVGWTMVLSASARGYGITRLTQHEDGSRIAPTTDGVSGLVIELEEGGFIEGSIADEQGRPIDGATLHTQSGEWDATTQSDGSFLLLGLEPGEHQLKGYVGDKELEFLNHDGVVLLSGRAQLSGLSLVAKRKPRDAITAALSFRNQHPQPGDTTGRVVDEEGNPVEGMEVSLVRGMSHSGLPSFTVTGPKGRFALDFGHRDEATLCTSADGYVYESFEGIRRGSMDNRLVVRRALPVRGLVQDAHTNAPIRRFEVHAAHPSTDDDLTSVRNSRGQAHTFFSPDGVFTVYSHHTDAIAIVVRAPGYAPACRTVELDARPESALATIKLTPQKRIAGVAVGPDDRPVPNARVHANHADDLRKSDGMAVTGADGSFTIPGLASRRYSIYVSHDDYVSTVADADLTGADTPQLRVHLELPGVLEGHVQRDGRPLVGAAVEMEAVTLNREEWRGVSGPITEWTDDEGLYRFRPVPAGLYRLRCDVYETYRAVDREVQEVVVEPGMTTEVDF